MIEFHQTHFFMGKNNLYISKDAVRLDNQSQLKFNLIAKAPNWDVIVYRTDDKTFFSESYAQFLQTGLLSKLLIGENLQNLNAPGFRESLVPIGPVKAICREWRTTTVAYLPIDGITARQVERILFATYQLPARDGLPIAHASALHGKDMITGLNEEGQRHFSLKTVAAESKEIPVRFFDLPEGYQRAKSMIDVVSGNVSKQRAADVDILMNDVHR